MAAPMIRNADSSEITKYGIVLPMTYDTVEIGAMRTCSQVPRSFSRTIDSEVDTTALIMTMKPMRPGTRNRVLWSSGLYQMRGSTTMGGATARPAASCICSCADTPRTIACA